MAILNTILYTAITLGVLIFVHELGHFLAAKLTGMRVDRFSIGFPPRAFGKKIGETDYCISWIPLGGYVKIAGMVDESFDTDFANQAPRPWEFRARPMWARMLVISAGVIMNVLLAVVIFWVINLSSGKFIKETTEIGYVISGSLADKAGLMAGDRIVSINGDPVSHWEQVQSSIFVDNFGSPITIDVQRSGQLVKATLPPLRTQDQAEQTLGIVEAHTKTVIQDVQIGRPAEGLGLKQGDEIRAINGIPIANRAQMISLVQSNAGVPIELTWKRGEETMSGTVTPDETGRIGVSLQSYYTGPVTRIDYTVIGALGAGFQDIARSVDMVVKTVGHIIGGRASFKESFGGPIAIAQLATQSAEMGLLTYMAFMALLSMSLAILNILPIPALDGGHLLMLSIEAVFRREIPHRVKLTIQQAGFILLLAFMAFIIYNDLSKF
jgi:regulator of sigma E protease